MLEDILKACLLDLKGSWDEHFPLIEFTYNNSYQASIQMVPYKALYWRPCQSSICWTEVGERSTTGPELISETLVWLVTSQATRARLEKSSARAQLVS